MKMLYAFNKNQNLWKFFGSFLFILVSSIVQSTVAWTNPVFAQRESPADLPVAAAVWQFAEAVDEVTAKTACHGFIDKNPQSAFELRFVAVKDRSDVPYLLFKVWPNASSGNLPAEPKYFLSIDNKVKHTLHLIRPSTNPDQPNIYWYAPTDFNQVIEVLIGGNFIKIVNASNALIANLSLKGSSAAFTKVEKCLGGNGYLPQDFLKSLNAAINPLPALGESGGQALWNSVRKAFAASLAGAALKKELQAVQAQIAALEPKEKTALTNFDKAFKTWEASNKKWTGLLERISQLQEENKNLAAQIDQLKTELGAAQADLAQKKATYDPLKAQLKPQEDEVSTLASAVRRLNSQIQDYESTISRNESKISELLAERDRLIRAIPGIESDLASAQRGLRDAQSALDRFDVPSVIRDRLWRHPWYNSKVQEKQTLERNIQFKRGDLRNAQFRQRDLQQQLNTCRAQPTPNCSQLESELRNQESIIRSLESDLNSMESNLRSLSWDIERIEQEVRSEVDRERNQLISNRSAKQNAVDELQESLNSKERRKRDIEGEVPILRSQNADLRGALPGLRSERDSKTTLLRQAEQRLADLRKSLNFDIVEQAYILARDRVADLQSGIQTKTAKIQQNQKDIQATQVQADKQKPIVEKNLAAKNKAESELKVLQDQLQPLRLRAAGLQENLNLAIADYQAWKGQYQALLKAL